MASLVNSKLGKYTMVERLGQGGMAEVYKALQPGVDRLVAIKVMHSHLTDKPEFVQRFQREARSIGRLEHPNIVRVIDFEDALEQSYMVMEYIPGETLSAYLKANQALPPANTLRIMVQLADALAYAHRQGVIHRDIKPTNVIFRDSGHSQAVLMDFGMAHLYEEDLPTLTVTGSIIGTPTYMSPEAIRGEATDERSDLYSLGVLFYELVTGKPPYVADTPYSMMRKLENEPLLPPRTINPAVPEAMEKVLLRMLAKLPADRYQTASELLGALAELQARLTNRPVPAPIANHPAPTPTTAPAPATAKSTPRKWMTLALASLAVILVAQVTVLFLTWVMGGGVWGAHTVSANSPQHGENLSPSITSPARKPSFQLRAGNPAPPRAVLTTSLPISAPASMTTSPLSPTVIAPPTGTVTPHAAVTVMPPPQERGVLLFHNSATTLNTDYLVEIGSIAQPPVGTHYKLWLRNDQGAVLDLGPLLVERGRISVGGSTRQNLSVDYNHALITIETDEHPAALPSGRLVLISTWPRGQTATTFQSVSGA